MNLFKKIFGEKTDCVQLVKNGAILIDVRTPTEFAQGNASGSKNIPLNTIEENIEKIGQLKTPVVLCCRSGMRSGQATSILKRNRIEAYNGGPWNKFIK